MTPDTIPSRLAAILSDHFGVRPGEVTRDTRLTDDLGADSLDLVEIAMEVEEEFDLAIPDEAAEGWRTAGDVMDWVAGKVGVEGR